MRRASSTFPWFLPLLGYDDDELYLAGLLH